MLELDHKERCVSKDWFFWTVVLKKTPESPLDCKIKAGSPKENQPWIFIGWLMLKLKLQYFAHLIWRADSLEKTLMLGKIEGKRRWGKQRRKWLDSITDSMDMSLSELWEIAKDRGTWHAAVHGVAKSQTRLSLSDWTTTNKPTLGEILQTPHLLCFTGKQQCWVHYS